MIQSINDLKSNIKDIGWNPFLVGGASGLGTYALTRLLGGNKWLAAALGLGVGTGAGWLQQHNNELQRDKYFERGHATGIQHGKHELEPDIREIAHKLGLPAYYGSTGSYYTPNSAANLLERINKKLVLSKVPTDNINRLTKADILLLRQYLDDQPALLDKIISRDKRLSFLNQRGHKLFMPSDDSHANIDSAGAEQRYYDAEYPAWKYPEVTN